MTDVSTRRRDQGKFATESRSAADLSEVDVPSDCQPAEDAPAGVSFAELDRDARIEAMRAEIDTAMDDLSNEEGWQRFLEQTSRFHRYSLGNTMLIAVQRPDASYVAGFNDWKNKHGRTVKKGEKAIWINAPVTRKVVETDAAGQDSTRSAFVGVRAVGVFDVSQTEGEPFESPGMTHTQLEGEAPAEMVRAMRGFIESKGFSIRSEPMGEDKGGHTDFGANEVVLNSDWSPRAQARTLAHEAAHIALGHGEDIAGYHSKPGGKRPDMEVEAESTAYILGRHHGIDEIGGSSFAYIEGWAQGDKARVKATAERVVKATKAILDTAPQAKDQA